MISHLPPHLRPLIRSVATLALGAALMLVSGCAFGAAIGGMLASEQRQGSHTVKAKYAGLKDKNFAVIVAADRAIQADFPSIVAVTTREITKFLAEKTPAKGYLPPDEVLKYQSQHPGWIAKPPDQLAKELGVERVVYVDLSDFALTDPGNPYVYNGVAAGNMHVVEVESPTPTEFAFTEAVRVRYPDTQGVSPSQEPRQGVLSTLASRFIQRASWMFYEHEEPNVIKY